jgi:putative hydrolase of the HAD superfamily
VWDSFAVFCHAKGLDDDAVKRLFREDPEALGLLRQLEVGAMSESDFERRFAERLGLDDAADLIDSMFRGMQPEPRMVDAVRAARRGGVKTGLLSNSWSTEHYDRDLLGELFDDVVISAEVGLHKPQPEIFRLACERLGVEPADAVFVDDLRENIAGAEEVGMVGVLHRDPDRTVAELEELLGISLRAPA